mmetsp:Transcript_20228/g.38061  ORF Transcript_20228/g.38061 Transcript_20228/m.38061 type:complete len:216 (+) Transcript_20228:694-1341(+)
MRAFSSSRCRMILLISSFARFVSIASLSRFAEALAMSLSTSAFCFCLSRTPSTVETMCLAERPAWSIWLSRVACSMNVSGRISGRSFVLPSSRPWWHRWWVTWAPKPPMLFSSTVSSAGCSLASCSIISVSMGLQNRASTTVALTPKSLSRMSAAMRHSFTLAPMPTSATSVPHRRSLAFPMGIGWPLRPTMPSFSRSTPIPLPRGKRNAEGPSS